MAMLVDHYDTKNYLELKFIRRDHRPDQGCRFLITSSQNGNEVSSDVGWTNVTLDRFVEMLTKFPMHFYDGYFSHYDESFEWKWIHEPSTNLYLVIIFISGMLLPFKLSIESIQKFGEDIIRDIENAN